MKRSTVAWSDVLVIYSVTAAIVWALVWWGR